MIWREAIYQECAPYSFFTRTAAIAEVKLQNIRDLQLDYTKARGLHESPGQR